MAPQLLHHARDRARGWRSEKRVDVVGHQHVGMQDVTRGKRALAQKLQVAAAVAVVEEAGQSIVAALDNIPRYAWRAMRQVSPHAPT
jgi:hypothetical protein